MDITLSPPEDHRPAADVLRSLHESCRVLLHDRAAFDDRYLNVLGGLLPAQHLLRDVPALALDLLDVVLRAVLSGESPEQTEAECQQCGERCASAGLADDAYPAIGRAVARSARDLAGEMWSASMSSGWAAVHLWVVGHLTAGAARGRHSGAAWGSFPELATSGPVRTAGDGPDPGLPAASEWALLERAAASGVVDPFPLADPAAPVGLVDPFPLADPAAPPVAPLAPDAEPVVEPIAGPDDVGPAPQAPPTKRRTRDRRALRAPRPGRPEESSAPMPDWSTDTYANPDAISNWAFDRLDRGRPGGLDADGR